MSFQDPCLGRGEALRRAIDLTQFRVKTLPAGKFAFSAFNYRSFEIPDAKVTIVHGNFPVLAESDSSVTITTGNGIISFGSDWRAFIDVDRQMYSINDYGIDSGTFHGTETLATGVPENFVAPLGTLVTHTVNLVLRTVPGNDPGSRGNIIGELALGVLTSYSFEVLSWDLLLGLDFLDRNSDQASKRFALLRLLQGGLKELGRFHDLLRFVISTEV